MLIGGPSWAHHPQGLCRFDDRYYLSTVDVERAEASLLCFDAAGRLQDRIGLTQGPRCHPGGFSAVGAHATIPVAEYRPDGTSVVCTVDLVTHEVTALFDHPDHLGAALQVDGGLVAMTWGSRHLLRFDRAGTMVRAVPNPSHYVDFQDVQLASGSLAACTGIASLRTGGGRVHLGGIALLAVDDLTIVHEVPFTARAPGGRVATSNPTWFTLDASGLALHAVPDDDAAHLQTWVATP